VLRRILRRAARYGRQYLSIDGPFVVKLVAGIVEMMGKMFPEIVQRQQYVEESIRDEEESFGRTLDRGIDLFQREADRLAAGGGKELSGDVAFDLYATYGFPVDLTQIMATERGMTVDMDGYDEAMARHREISGSGAAFKADEIPDLPACDSSAKYSAEPIEATVSGWIIDGAFATSGALSTSDEAAIVLDVTNFYGEQGGQMGDAGHLIWDGGKFAVRDTQVAGAAVLHLGVVEAGTLKAAQKVRCEVGPARIDTMRNHTATHLLNWALAKVLGGHVNQAGSVVAPDRLRFDFSHNQALTADQLAEVERLTNRRILLDDAVSVEIMPLAKANEIPGVRAVFGEKYPDPVRVVAMGSGDDSNVEFCGGTHLERTGRVGLFKIIAEESIAKGIRRITALTGAAAVDHVQSLAEIVRTASTALKVPAEQVAERLAALQAENRKLKKAGGAPAIGGSEQFQADVTIETPDGNVLIGRVGHVNVQAMRKECDRQRQKGAAAMLIGGADDSGKVMLVARVDQCVAEAGKLKAGAWVKAVAPIVGGGGGGKDTMAQAGGKQADKLDKALSEAADWVRQQLK